MPWTAPTTNVAGTAITSGWGNSNVRDNSLFLRATPQNRCSAYASSTQSHGSNVTDALTLNTDVYDTAAMHDTGSNTERVTIPSGGDGAYYAFGKTRIQSISNDAFLKLRKNGGGGTVLDTFRVPAACSGMGARVSAWFAMVATDYFDLACQTGTGGAVTGSGSDAAEATRLTVVGPLPYA